MDVVTGMALVTAVAGVQSLALELLHTAGTAKNTKNAQSRRISHMKKLSN